MDTIHHFFLPLWEHIGYAWRILPQLMTALFTLYLTGLVFFVLLAAVSSGGTLGKVWQLLGRYHGLLRKALWLGLLPLRVLYSSISVVFGGSSATMSRFMQFMRSLMYFFSLGKWGRVYPKEGSSWLHVGRWLWKESSLNFSPHTGAKIAHDCFVSRKRMMTHGVCVGATESGKTTMLEQMLLELIFSKNKPNILITDPKGILHKRLLVPLMTAGYDVQILNSREIDKSVRYNLLHFLEDTPGDIRALLKMLKKSGDVADAKDDNWMAWGYDHCTLMVRLVLRMKNHLEPSYIGLHQVLHLIKMSQSQEAFITDLIAQFGDKRMEIDWMEFQAKNGSLKAGVVSNAKNIVAMFEDEQICALLSSSTTLNLSAINNTKDDQPACIIGAMDENDMERLGFALSHINKQAIIERTRNKPLERARESYFFFEELTQLPVIDGLAKSVSYVRQFLLGLVLIVQSRNLFMELYGQGTVKAIEDNIGFQAYCGISPNDAEAVERRLGDTISVHKSKHGGNTRERKPLMSRQKLEQMGRGSLLLFQRQKRPALLPRYAHDNHRYFFKPYKKLDAWEAMAESVEFQNTGSPVAPQYLYPDEEQSEQVTPHTTHGEYVPPSKKETPQASTTPKQSPAPNQYAASPKPPSLDVLIQQLQEDD